ncbi:MAG: 50S ribosomal protein L30 [Fusobacteria bacterium]|jgi:large subunit ribosomal protein L30|nr:50S ribosomal protein L30 [Fusobacteriota bacterium]
MAKKLRITLVKSTIGRLQKHRDTLASLGLKKIDSVVEKEATPDILGKIRQISYLVNVEEV